MEFNFLIYDQIQFYKDSIEIVVSAKYPNSNILVAENENQIFDLLGVICFDLLILDVNFQGNDNFAFIKKIKSAYPKLNILVFSSSNDNVYIAKCLNHGATSYFSKSGSVDMFLKFIAAALAGKNFNFKSKIDFFKPLNEKKIKHTPFDSLSKREKEILLYFLKGSSVKSISSKFKLATTTISTYKKRIFTKTNVNNIIELSELYKIYYNL